jgi:hypothetical protein
MVSDRELATLASAQNYHIHRIGDDFKELPMTDFLELFDYLVMISRDELPLDHRLCFQIETCSISSADGNIRTEKDRLLSRILGEGKVILADSQGNISFGMSTGENFCIVDASCLSKRQSSLVIFFDHYNVWILDKGETIYFANVFDVEGHKVGNSKRKPIRSYRELLDDFYEQQAKYDYIGYWHSIERRILKYRAENLFKCALCSFLRAYMLDGNLHRELEVPNSRDQVDIFIQSLSTNKYYIIEIKIKGVMCSRQDTSKIGTRYTDTHMNSGARQIILYLEAFLSSSTPIEKAILVIYDGSGPPSRCIKWSNHTSHEKLEKIRYYLESESASKRSKKSYA